MHFYLILMHLNQFYSKLKNTSLKETCERWTDENRSARIADGVVALHGSIGKVPPVLTKDPVSAGVLV